VVASIDEGTVQGYYRRSRLAKVLPSKPPKPNARLAASCMPPLSLTAWFSMRLIRSLRCVGATGGMGWPWTYGCGRR